MTDLQRWTWAVIYDGPNGRQYVSSVFSESLTVVKTLARLFPSREDADAWIDRHNERRDFRAEQIY